MDAHRTGRRRHARRSGLVCEAQLLGSDGGLARYRLTVVPWLWLLSQGRHSRVFQNQGVLEIAAAVFADYADYAAWTITSDARALLADVRQQYHQDRDLVRHPEDRRHGEGAGVMRLTRMCLLALLAALLAACHRAPTEQEKQVMAQLTRSMKTQCMGRYLVDLPDSFKWLHPDVTLYYGQGRDFKTLEVQVLDTKATPESFDKAVGEEAAKIRAETIFGTSTSLLLEQTGLKGGGIMLSYYSDLYGTGQTHHLHVLVGSTHVLVKGSSYEKVPGLTDEERDLSPAVEARMLKLAAQIHPVTDPEKAGPGFCLGGVVVDSDNDYEQGTLNFVQGTGNSRMMLEVGTSSFKERDSSDPDLIHRDNKYLSLAPSEKSLRQGTS